MEEVSALILGTAHTARQYFPLESLKGQKFNSIGPRLRKNISKLKFTTEEKPTCPSLCMSCVWTCSGMRNISLENPTSRQDGGTHQTTS